MKVRRHDVDSHNRKLAHMVNKYRRSPAHMVNSRHKRCLVS